MGLMLINTDIISNRGIFACGASSLAPNQVPNLGDGYVGIQEQRVYVDRTHGHACDRGYSFDGRHTEFQGFND